MDEACIDRASLEASSGCACLKTLYTAVQARLNFALAPFDETLRTLEAAHLSKRQLAPEDVYAFSRRLNLQHVVWHLYAATMDDGVEVLGRNLQQYDLPWVVFTPLPDSWKLILGMRGSDVLVFDPTKHAAPVQFTPEHFGGLAVWRPLTECVAEWGDDVTPAQAVMLLPHTLPPFPEDVREREETYTFLMMAQPTSMGAMASKTDREALGLVDSWNFVYGEITFSAMAEMLRIVSNVSNVMAKPDCKFVDLGSGAGKAVIAAAMLHPFEVCEGVELLQTVYALSMDILEEFDEQIRPNISNDSTARQVRFVRADMLQHDWSDADVVLLHWTTFTADVVAAITAAATKLRPGSVVITVSQPLAMPDKAADAQQEAPFRIVFEQFHTFSWGETVVFYQTRTSAPGAVAAMPSVKELADR